MFWLQPGKDTTVQFESGMTRAGIERIVEPIILNCLREFGDLTPKGVSEEELKTHTKGTLRPDVRRVSLMVSLAQSVLGSGASGEGLEVGSGYAYLLFPMAKFLPDVHWSAVDHPGRAYLRGGEYLKAFQKYNCQFASLDLIRERLPFPDGYFQVVTFSEVLEHLPVERVYFVLSEIARVVRPGGVLVASSPNQASLENRLRLLKGKSILDMPDEIDCAKGIFGHIRLYTRLEMESAMSRLGFSLVRCVMESNNSGYRGVGGGSWRRRIYRMYERAEERLGILRGLGDTWYIAFRKNGERTLERSEER